jgi:transposase
LPKHPMAEAVNQALGPLAELNAFCSDGAVTIDNNISEREMKRVVLNRKNSLFVGSLRGERTGAITVSHPAVDQPAGGEMSELSAWLPDQWKTSGSNAGSVSSHPACGSCSARNLKRLPC